MASGEFFKRMYATGWVNRHEELLTHPQQPDLQYIIFEFWGVIEQRRYKGRWHLGQGWSWGRFRIEATGRFVRL